MTAVSAPAQPVAEASPPRVAAVLLNFNSAPDLRTAAELLSLQEGVSLRLVLVDNASAPEDLRAVLSWLRSWRPDAQVLDEAEVPDLARWPDRAAGDVLLVRNPVNRGYSAGNNVGIRVGLALGADYVLVANPDVEITDPGYVRGLVASLEADEGAVVAASRILGLDGHDQNPAREPGFLEELCWPLSGIFGRLRRRRHGSPMPAGPPLPVGKVSGCCMLLRMDFLRDVGLLDEGVFLYSEEPILAATVRRAGRRILLVPSLRALHAHRPGAKGPVAGRMLLFIRSRRYYLKAHSGYGPVRLRLLLGSYRLMELWYKVRRRLGR